MNKYQTVFTDDDFKTVPKELRGEFYEILESVQFVKSLIQPEEVRGFARNRPKYSSLSEDNPEKLYDDNRIIVDLAKPHILENLDFFRERAIHFDKYGKYTNIIPNPNPKSDWKKFWKEELRRWKYGLIRPSDGEWIPGALYFYWNYCPIWLVEETGKKIKGKKTAGERVRKFPHPWLGDYLFYHYLEQAKIRGQHVKVLKTRGVGISFKMGSLSPRNMYVYPGSGNPNFHLASDKSYLQGDKGVFGKVIDTLDWIAEHTPLPKLRLGDSKRSMEVQLGYQDEYGVRKGLLSSVFGVSLKDNPDKARGIRGIMIHYEEDGTFDHLEDAWNINRKAAEDGNVGFCLMAALGTGGSMGSAFAGSEKLFYYPDTYNIYGLPNVYDKNATGDSKCGFFWGAYLNRNGCYDKETGEPDVTKAIFEVLLDRYLVKKGAGDSKAITQKRAEEPITPQDAVMRVEGTIFPVAELKDYLAEISPNMARFVAPHYTGTLIPDSDGTMKLVLANGTLTPIREFPATENKVGCIEIFEVPARVKDNYRYILGIDTYDDDEVTYSNSLGSAIVFDRWTRRIVAEYTGRPETANAFYEIVYRLAIYYNATIMYENNKKGLYGYFQMIKKNIGILADTPEFILDKQTLKPRNVSNNTTKGINATAAINAYGRRLQVDWMLENAYEEEMDLDDMDNPKPVTNNIHKIRSIGYIKECIAWNADINCDRCLPEGSLIETSNGIAPIEEIKIEDLVLTKSGIYHPVKVLHKNAYNGKFVKFKVMGDFREIECTANHPIFIRRYLQKPSGVNWFKLKYNLPQGNYIEASEIALKDYVMLPKRVNLPESTIPADLLYVLGWYLSDGWVSSKTSTVKFYFQYDQYELALDVLKILNYRFNSKYTEVSKRIEHTGRVVNNFKTKKRRVEGVLYRSKDSNMWVVQKTDLELKNFLISNCGTANNKKISKSLYNSSNLLPFIRGFFEGDGHYRAEYRCDGSFRKSLELSSIYKETIFKIRQILLDMGIWNSIRFVDYSKKANSKNQYTITITGDYCNQIVENSKKFKQKFPLEQNKVKILRVLEDDNGFYTPIVKIDNYNKECMVYNISVDTDESYIVNGILTHNCSAMNMVMLYDMALTEYGTKTSKEKTNTLANDKFFNRKYRSKYATYDN